MAGSEFSRRDPEARRERVLEAAKRLFAERGYESTSVNDVAALAGVSVGALYKYYRDKPALLEGVLDASEARFAEGMAMVRGGPGTHRERLHVMIAGIFAMAATEPSFYWALTSGTHALRGARDHTSGDRVRAEIRAFVASGTKAGEFRRVDPDAMAALGYGIVETAMRRCFGPGGETESRRAWEKLVEEVLWRAVAPG